MRQAFSFVFKVHDSCCWLAFVGVWSSGVRCWNIAVCPLSLLSDLTASIVLQFEWLNRRRDHHTMGYHVLFARRFASRSYFDVLLSSICLYFSKLRVTSRGWTPSLVPWLSTPPRWIIEILLAPCYLCAISLLSNSWSFYTFWAVLSLWFSCICWFSGLLAWGLGDMIWDILRSLLGAPPVGNV